MLIRVRVTLNQPYSSNPRYLVCQGRDLCCDWSLTEFWTESVVRLLYNLKRRKHLSTNWVERGRACGPTGYWAFICHLSVTDQQFYWQDGLKQLKWFKRLFLT